MSTPHPGVMPIVVISAGLHAYVITSVNRGNGLTGILVTAALATAWLLHATTSWRAGILRRRWRTATSRIRNLTTEITAVHTDPLTGLPNRSAALRHIAGLGGIQITVAYIDVKNMRGINNRHGHHGGDTYLAHIATRLRQLCTPGDLLARLGSDDFVLITARLAHDAAATLSSIDGEPVTIGNSAEPIQIHIGLCRTDARSALQCADLAIATAKRRHSTIAHYQAARDGIPTPPPNLTTPRARRSGGRQLARA